MTKPGDTYWKKYNCDSIRALTLTVDTSAAKFISVPAYVISLGGGSAHWDLLGASCVYKASRTSFEVNLRRADGGHLSPEEANRLHWHVNWIGVENID
ncbi:MAG: hypothetical protein KDJ25_13350 [Rhodoblastus sp.]|nr:hypothetical protein [Rhodoblastus sp.]